jgi:hypothetical protein
MNRKTIMIIAFIAILAITLAYIIVNWPTSPVTIYVAPSTIAGAVGEDFTININISNVVDLYAWKLKLRWNVTILEAVNVAEGSFLKNGGSTLFIKNNTAGNIILDCTLIGDISGVSGKGTLATIQFQVNRSGNCDLDLYDTMLASSSEKYITHTVSGGHFST